MRFHPVTLGGMACFMLSDALAEVHAFPNGNWLLASLVLSGTLMVLPVFVQKGTDLGNESNDRHECGKDV